MKPKYETHNYDTGNEQFPHVSVEYDYDSNGQNPTINAITIYDNENKIVLMLNGEEEAKGFFRLIKDLEAQV